MNRRLPAVRTKAFTAVCALIAVSALSSCATFDRNEVAAQVGDQDLTAEAVEALAATGTQPATGDQLREQLTKWIRVTVLEAAVGMESATPTTSTDLDNRLSEVIVAVAGDNAATAYASGVSGSPVICLAAITANSVDDANSVLATVQAGRPFADAAREFSTDTVIAGDGGIVRGQDGGECIDPAAVNPEVVASLDGIPIGQAVVADLGTFAAVLMLRPFDELLPESRSLIASASVPQDQLDAIVDAADIYVDPRYGRWDPDVGSVVILTS